MRYPISSYTHVSKLYGLVNIFIALVFQTRSWGSIIRQRVVCDFSSGEQLVCDISTDRNAKNEVEEWKWWFVCFYTEVSYPEFINSLPSPLCLSETAFPIQSYKHHNTGQLLPFNCYMPTSVVSRRISSINFWIKITFFNVDQKHTDKLGHPRGYFYGPIPEMILYELGFLLPLVLVVNIISNKIAQLWS